MKYIQISLTLFDHDWNWRWHHFQGFRFNYSKLGMNCVFDFCIYLRRL